MNSLRAQALPILQAMWRQRWLGVGIAWLVCTVGWIAIAFIPTEYESSARVYLNADPVLTPLLQGLAANTDPARHLDFMERTLLSRPNLEELVRLTDLDVGATTPAQKEALFAQLAGNIDVRPLSENLMTISYRNHDPQVARNVVQSLLTIFADKTSGSSRSEMDSAQRFLDEEIASYRDQLRAAEQRRGALARQYPDIVSDSPPGSGPAAVEHASRLDQARGAVAQARDALADAVTKRDSLKSALASVPPMLDVDRAPQVVIAGAAVSPEQARLEELRRNLDTLRLKYTDQYPDVIATRQEITQLKSEVKRTGTSGVASDKTQIANAVYDRLKVELVDAESAVATAQRHLQEAEAYQAQIDKIVQSAPGILEKVRDMDRDYDVLRNNYQQLVARRESASIADAADTRTEKIQFRIVDPPRVPLVPVAPHRPFLVSVVLLLGIGAGFAAPLAMTQLDRSFATVSQLRNLGIPILGSVSRLALGTARRQATMQLAGVCASAVVLIAVYGTLLALSFGLHSVSVS
ncbi:MAG: XrtA system polysaccharide chain length determinant [Stellaceae bacterium]